MLAAYQAFLARPTAENYVAVRELGRQMPGEASVACDWDKIADDCRRGNWAAVQHRLEWLLPHWILSARWHFYAGLVAEETGDISQAELERFQFQACLDGLLATGNGSPDQPYVVTYATDVRDVLEALKLRPQVQWNVGRNGQTCEVVRCRGGRELWFDLSHALLPTPSVAPLALAN